MGWADGDLRLYLCPIAKLPLGQWNPSCQRTIQLFRGNENLISETIPKSDRRESHFMFLCLPLDSNSQDVSHLASAHLWVGGKKGLGSQTPEKASLISMPPLPALSLLPYILRVVFCCSCPSLYCPCALCLPSQHHVNPAWSDPGQHTANSHKVTAPGHVSWPSGARGTWTSKASP